ncbi:MAG: ParA family protein [Gemmatimonadaceae bacterium]|nr:ParA family protein [Gemmatimonadaceae bacterium]
MARILAVANQKGGVGKTTTAVNVAAGLAAAERNVLLVDGDPQANATSGLGVDHHGVSGSSYDVLLSPETIGSCIQRGVQFDRLDLLPATPDLAAAELELVGTDGRESRMRQALGSVSGSYDYIIIDCPPSLGLLTINMLVAADALLIPLQCEYYALEGLSQLLHTIERVQTHLNPDLVIDGVVLTMYDSRLNLSRQVVEDAKAHFGDTVFSGVVPRNIRLAEAPSFGKSIISYDVSSVGAQAYLGIVGELIARTEARDRNGLAIT